MKVSIDKIETNGLRCPDAKIVFKDKDSGASLNLLQMPNATGKTTIIKLLGPTLSGEIRNWGSKMIKSFKSREDVSSGLFSVSILTDINKKKSNIQFIVRFNFEHGTVDFTTSRSETSGEEDGWLPPREIKPYITEGCVDVFCFRGDKVNDLIDSNKSDAEETIKAFFGITSSEDFLQSINTHFRATVSQQANVNDRVINSKSNLLKAWEGRFKILKSDFEDLKNSESQINNDLQDLRERSGRIIASVENGAEEESKHASTVQKHEERVALLSNEYWDTLKNPFTISNELVADLFKMRESLEKMKLPGGSKTFFDDMIEFEENCICGEELTEEKVDHIKKTIENYLGDDEITIINQIKEEIKISFKDKDGEENLNTIFSTLKEAVSSRDKAKIDERNFLEGIKEMSSEENKKIFDEYDKKQIEVIQITGKINNRTKEYKPSGTELNNPASCKSWKAAELAISELSDELGTMSDMIDDVNAHAVLVKIITGCKENSLKRLKEKVRELTNKMILQTLRANSGYEIKVESFDKFLQLGWNGVEQSEGSGAQNIIVAYSFVRAILEEATIQFPLIVDHPFTNVDIGNRRDLGSKLTTLMHQFIGFLIDVERPGFLEGVEKSGDEVRYISLFRNNKENEVYAKKMEKMEQDLYYKSDSGLLCYDKEFFLENSMGTK